MKHDPKILEAAKATTDELLSRIGVSAPGAKKARGAGRPKREGVERYANGQIKRSERERDIREVAVRNRMKHRGVTLAQATDQRAGTPLGRLQLGGLITEAQALAGEAYIKLLTRLRAAEGLGSEFAKAQSVWGSEGVVTRADFAPTLVESDDRVEYVVRKRAELDTLEAFVRERGGSQAIGWLRGLRSFALDDEISTDAILAHPSAMSCLRAALNLLGLFFKIGDRRVAR
jgi:hypothetical protein